MGHFLLFFSPDTLESKGNNSHDMSADSSAPPRAKPGNSGTDSIGAPGISPDLRTDTPASTFLFNTTPNATLQSGSQVAIRSKNFPLFPRFPAEIQDQIFVEAAYTPRCHLFFVILGWDSKYMICSYKSLREEDSERVDKLMRLFRPRLPVSGHDDRLSISLTCKAAKRVIDLVIRTRPDDWKKIGTPGTAPVLFNTASDLAWIAGDGVPWWRPNPEGRNLSLLDALSFVSSGHPTDPLYHIDLQAFAGIKRLALDLWPNMLSGDIYRPDFAVVCLLLNHFADLQTLYFMDIENFESAPKYPNGSEAREILLQLEQMHDKSMLRQIPEDAPEVQEEMSRGSRYHFQNPKVFNSVAGKDLDVPDEYDGIERFSELHSRADDTFLGRVEVVGDEKWYGQFREFRGTPSLLRQIHKAVCLFRRKLLDPVLDPDFDLVLNKGIKEDGCLTKEGVNEILEKQKKVDFKLLAWELVSKD